MRRRWRKVRKVFTSMQTHLSQPCRDRTNHVMWVIGAGCCNPAGHAVSSTHSLDSHVQPPAKYPPPPQSPGARFDHGNRYSHQSDCGVCTRPCEKKWTCAMVAPCCMSIHNRSFPARCCSFRSRGSQTNAAKISHDLTLISSNKLDHFP